MKWIEIKKEVYQELSKVPDNAEVEAMLIDTGYVTPRNIYDIISYEQKINTVYFC